jgi:L-lactate dehydrogenase complex protein LldG
MNNEARQAIIGSIRSHLAASMPYDKPEFENEQVEKEQVRKDGLPPPLVDLFKQRLESVGVRCRIASSDSDIADALTRIITDLKAQRLAISDDPEVKRLLYQTDLEIEELGIAPNASDVFRFDVGITTAQTAIAETGTLVLDSVHERHRLVSLVPPVHIAIVSASTICETVGEALTLLRKENEISSAVTFITGPSRTADIELTLTVGVHGPQELYVIINQSN